MNATSKPEQRDNKTVAAVCRVVGNSKTLGLLLGEKSALNQAAELIEAMQPTKEAGWLPIETLTEDSGDALLLTNDLLVFRGFCHECQGEGDEDSGLYILKKVGQWIPVKPSEVKGWMPMPATADLQSILGGA